jgi:HAE1 family hydrophobic/amphiphilic exporter-1
MRSVEFSVRRPVTVSMLTVAVVMFGMVAFQRLPINLLPDLSYPSLTVETRFSGAAPAEVESLITRRVEEAVGILPGVRRIASRSRPGLSQVTLEFVWGREMALASLDVRQKVDLVQLPKEAEKPQILRFDPSTDPIMRLYLTGSPNLYRLRYVGEELLKKDLESLDGVAAVKVNGGLEEEIQVRLDEGKLALVRLKPSEVQAVLARENVNQAGGSLYEEEARYLVRANNEFKDTADILDTIVSEKEGRVVRLSDVAAVVRSHRQREVMTRFAGQEAVELAVYKEGDANTVRVARLIRRRLEALKKEVPEGIEVGTAADQSRFIESSIDEVMSNAILGGLLAMLVLYLFLKDAYSTAIIGVSIPISIIATFFMMHRMGVTLNVMSLGGLALGVGMLVDNAIVVLEAIFRRREEEGEDAPTSAAKGASEVGMPVVASTLTTVAVFLPVVFVEGVAAQLFRDQALTVSFSLLASLAVALTLIPMVAARGRARTGTNAAERGSAVPERQEGQEGQGGRAPGKWARVRGAVLVTAPAFLLLWIRRFWSLVGRAMGLLLSPLSRVFDRGLAGILSVYPFVLGRALARPWTVLGIASALLVASVIGGAGLGFDLIPNFAQGEFSYEVELPEGTPLAVTDRSVTAAQSVLEGDPRVESYSAVIGGAGLSLTSTGTEGENFGKLDVRLKPAVSAAGEQVTIDGLRDALARIPGARVKFQRPSYFSFRTAVEVEVYGDDVAALSRVAGDLKDRLSAVRGLVDVRSSTELGNPELQVRFDRDALASLRLDLAQVAATVRQKVRGEVATRLNEGDREIDILVRSTSGQEVKVEDVQNLIVDHRSGTPVYLTSVATISRELGPTEIRRIGQKRAAIVSANLEGRSLGSAADDIRAVLREYLFPVNVVAGLSGQEEERQRSFASLLLALALALFLVYLVMAAQFESFLHPFIILFTVPLGGIGALFALVLARQPINVVVMIGLVMLGGIVVNNAIVLIDAVNKLRAEGHPRREALRLAGLRRMRPILMTTGTTVLGLLPMALGIGEGAELRAPLAITVIGGLSGATLLTLIVIPAVYELVERRKDPVPAAPGVLEAARGGQALA